jgi:uncharacterized protein (DUF1330 family)
VQTESQFQFSHLQDFRPSEILFWVKQQLSIVRSF